MAEGAWAFLLRIGYALATSKVPAPLGSAVQHVQQLLPKHGSVPLCSLHSLPGLCLIPGTRGILTGQNPSPQCQTKLLARRHKLRKRRKAWSRLAIQPSSEAQREQATCLGSHSCRLTQMELPDWLSPESCALLTAGNELIRKQRPEGRKAPPSSWFPE